LDVADKGVGLGIDAFTMLEMVDMVSIENSSTLCSERCVLPGVFEVLEQVESVGYVNTLATGNSRRRARQKIEGFKLWTRFRQDLNVFGDTCGLRTELLRESEGRIGSYFVNTFAAVDVPHIVVVGDTPLDIEAGRAIGSTVGVATGVYGMPELRMAHPNVVIESLESGQQELLNLLRSNGSSVPSLERVPPV